MFQSGDNFPTIYNIIKVEKMSEKNEKTFNVTIERDTYKRYKLLADYQGMSINKLTATLISKFIDNNSEIVSAIEDIGKNKKIKF